MIGERIVGLRFYLSNLSPFTISVFHAYVYGCGLCSML